MLAATAIITIAVAIVAVATAVGFGFGGGGGGGGRQLFEQCRSLRGCDRTAAAGRECGFAARARTTRLHADAAVGCAAAIHQGYQGQRPLRPRLTWCVCILRSQYLETFACFQKRPSYLLSRALNASFSASAYASHSHSHSHSASNLSVALLPCAAADRPRPSAVFAAPSTKHHVSIRWKAQRPGPPPGPGFYGGLHSNPKQVSAGLATSPFKTAPRDPPSSAAPNLSSAVEYTPISAETWGGDWAAYESRRHWLREVSVRSRRKLLLCPHRARDC